MKKIIKVSMSYEFNEEDYDKADEVYSKFSELQKSMGSIGQIIMGRDFGFREERDSYPETTCEWCEQDFERTVQGVGPDKEKKG